MANPFFGKEVCAIFNVKTMRLEFVMADVLHVVDQGVAVHIIGNVFVEVMSLKHWGTTQDKQVEGLQVFLPNCYNHLRSYQTN